MLTPERLKEIKQRAERATKGPWAVVPNRHKGKDGRPWGKIVAYLRTPTGGALASNIMTWGDDNGPADAEFVAHAREDVPALVDEVERLWGLVGQLRDQIEHWKRRVNELRDPATWRDEDDLFAEFCRGMASGLSEAIKNAESILNSLEGVGNAQ